MRTKLAAVLAVALTVSYSQLPAADTAPPLRVLVTHGGHAFEEGPFFAMFDALPGVRYRAAEMPREAHLLAPALRADTDVIVMYDMVGAITPEQQQAFLALLHEGIGVVSLHHNLGAHRGWTEFPRVIGGKFVFADETLEGQAYTKSTWRHGETLPVEVADRKHPITRGIENFQIVDESYGGYYTASAAHVLLTTDHPRNDPELAWTTNFGKSRVFYLMLGHDHEAWQHPAYPQLLVQGIRWAAGKD